MSLTKLAPVRCQTCRLAPEVRTQTCLFRHDQRAAGETLLEQGTVPSKVIYLRRGHAVLTESHESGRDLSCAVRGPDTMLGLEAVFARPMPYEVRALTDVTLCFLGIDAFKAWIGPVDSPLGTALRFSLDEAARRAGERHAVEGTALRRVARFLLQTPEKPAGAEPLDIPLGVLAGVLGMRPETLSRALSDLRAVGALAPERTVRVVSHAKLRLAAE